MKTNLHENSLLAWHLGQFDAFPQRELLILRALKELGSATDRGIQEHLELPERGMVQPRCSELKKRGLLEECGKVKCPMTGLPVRLLRIRPYQDPAQLEMFA